MKKNELKGILLNALVDGVLTGVAVYLALTLFGY